MNKTAFYFLLTALLLLSITSLSFAQFELAWQRNQPGGLGNIHGITVNPANNNIFICDFRSVHQFDRDLNRIRQINFNLGEIRGLGFDSDRNLLLIASYANSRYTIADLEGRVLEDRAAGATINTIAYDSDRQLYILGDWNRRVIFINRQFEVVSQFNVEVNITGICYYPINGTVFVLDTNDPILEYSIQGQLLARPIPNDVINDNGQDIGYDPGLRLLYATGQGGWVGAFNDNYGALPEPAFEPEEFNLVVPIGAACDEILTITNVGEENSILQFQLSDEGEGVDWLTMDPAAGRVELNEEVEVTVTASAADLEPGQFARTIVMTTNCPEAREIEIPVTLTVIAAYGELRGAVTDASNNRPIEGALVQVELLNHQTRTDAEGRYRFERIEEWNHTVHISAENFHTQTHRDIIVREDEVTVLDAALLHSVCRLSRNNIQINLNPGQEQDVEVELFNPGNGPLIWSAELDFPDELERDPWELRRSFAISALTGDPRIAGVVFQNDHFYVAGHANGQHLIYILDREGNVVDRINQLGQSQYGMQDLAWDGEWLWGSGERRIFGFTPDGQEQVVFNGAFNPMNNLAWDSDREILWASGSTTNIVGYNREGQEVARLDRRGLRQYGLAYYPQDPDGCPLYIFHSPSGNMMVVTKMNPANNDTLPVATIGRLGRAAGAEISNAWDPYSWVFIGTANADADDRLEIIHLSAQTNWVSLEPMVGELAAGEREMLNLNLNAGGLSILRYTTEAVFTHNGVGNITRVPIILDVSAGRVHAERTLAMSGGWNMVSLNVDPDEPDIRAMWQPIVARGALVMLKDGIGRFYRPEFDFCNIPGWVVSEGYQVRVTEACELVVPGTTMLPDDPIQLIPSWQIAAYYPRQPTEVRVALSGIVDNLRIAKDAAGHFYLPAWDFNNMDPLREGQGYQLAMNQADELVYCTQNAASAAVAVKSQLPAEDLPATGANMSLLVLGERSLDAELAVMVGGLRVGGGRLEDGVCGMAIWGNDAFTPEPDGAEPGQSLEIGEWTAAEFKPLEFTTLEGSPQYQKNAIWVIQLKNDSSPTAFKILSAYPNPFNCTTVISFSIPVQAPATLKVMDVQGREVKTLSLGWLNAGEHRIIWNAEGFAAGNYLLKLETLNRIEVRRVYLVK